MGNTATDNKSEEVVDKAPAKTEAKAAEKKPEEKKTATTAAKKPEEKKSEEKKPEEKKSEEKKVEDKKTENKKVEDKPTATEGAESKLEAKPEKEDAPVTAEATTEEDTKDEYPYDIILKKSISTYRGPSIELLNKPFGGKLTVLGVTGTFFKVQFVRAGFGTVVAYVLCEEVQRWAS